MFVLSKKTSDVKGPGKRGHIVADTLLPMFLGLRKLGNICCGHKMFLNKIRNILVSRTQNLCPQQMLRARVNRETFVSATICPQQYVLVCQGHYAFPARDIWRREPIKSHCHFRLPCNCVSQKSQSKTTFYNSKHGN